jgi:predicted transcriptional regulator
MMRRSRMEVFMDIMKVAAVGKIRRTHIMYRANLAWTVLKEALQVLEERGILRTESKGHEIYISLTEQGFKTLRQFSEIENAFSIAAEEPRQEAFYASTIA